ncbi:MAG: PrgI family protein [bacterium]|nr:PrgI family protein [bacterium]
MQFQVPQFIEIEDKIVGPLTLKQFAYVAVGALFSFLLFFVFEFLLWLIFTAFIAFIAVSLGFLKYNGRPMIVMIFAALEYMWRPHFYVWKREDTQQTLPSLPEISRVRKSEEQKKPLENLWEKLNTTTQPIHMREKGGLNIFKKEPVQQFEVQRKATGERRVYKRIDYR